MRYYLTPTAPERGGPHYHRVLDAKLSSDQFAIVNRLLKCKFNRWTAIPPSSHPHSYSYHHSYPYSYSCSCSCSCSYSKSQPSSINPYLPKSVPIRVHPWFKKPPPRAAIQSPSPPPGGRGVRGEGPKPKSFPKIRAYLYSSVVQKNKPHAVIQSHSPPPGEIGEGPNPKSFPKNPCPSVFIRGSKANHPSLPQSSLRVFRLFRGSIPKHRVPKIRAHLYSSVVPPRAAPRSPGWRKS